MLSKAMKATIADCHQNTSDPVRAWLTERYAAANDGNPWAEAQLKVFVKKYRQCGSGVQTLRYLEGGDHSQTAFDFT